MRGVLVEVPAAMIADRRRLGLDGRDEQWEGVLHMVPPPRGERRVPDQLFCRPEHASERGAEGAELVVEIRSAGDETYAKLDFYAAVGVAEVLVVHPEERRVELFRLVGERLLPVSADAEGGLRSEVLGVRFTLAGDGLHLSWDGGTATL